MISPDKNLNIELNRILACVQKPGRYTGGELNQIVKNWDEISTHVALVFPDIYEIGMSNLGIAILYDQINRREDSLAERVFAPWVDMEMAMRNQGIPLFSLETKRPLIDFDIIGFSLPYETLYTNTLNLLDLSGIPLLSVHRNEKHPLIIAGGHATFNPEPMHAFIDAFVIGEGEEVIHEIISVYQEWKEYYLNTIKSQRQDLLLQLAKIWGVYVPSLYDVSYHADGTIARIEKKVPEIPLPVIKRIVPKLPPPVTRFIVPYIETVHNRISVEIMRGCSRGCRFCQAGMVNRPVRERPVEQIIQSIDEALALTGLEEVSLLSLSSSDYTQISELVKQISNRYSGKNLSITLPSLRIESFSIELMEALKATPHSGFTLAPEAGSERMRNIINKPINNQNVLDVVQEIFLHGWNNIKLYFMIGHPSEKLEDVLEIINLCKSVLRIGRKIIGGRVQVTAGVSTFIPKPHTPFQWVSCDTLEQITSKQELLKKELRGPGLKLNWNNPNLSLLEAWLSRGDRRMADVILSAWISGAKFDAWEEHFRYETWQQAFKQTGLDLTFYTHRTRPTDEIFPWDHISISVSKKYLLDDYLMSRNNETRPDCRERCFACGILPVFSELRRDHPGPGWKCPEVPKNQHRNKP